MKKEEPHTLSTLKKLQPFIDWLQESDEESDDEEEEKENEDENEDDE